MSNTPTGLGTSGLGTPLGGGLGGGLSLGANSVGGSAGLGYNDYDRSYDRGDDGYRNSRASDTIIVRNVSLYLEIYLHFLFIVLFKLKRKLVHQYFEYRKVQKMEKKKKNTYKYTLLRKHLLYKIYSPWKVLNFKRTKKSLKVLKFI